MKNLGISVFHHCEEINTTRDFETSNPVALLKSMYHPLFLKIKEFVGEYISEFHFSETTIETIENKIKKGTFKNVLPKCLLETLDVSGPILLNI